MVPRPRDMQLRNEGRSSSASSLDGDVAVTPLNGPESNVVSRPLLLSFGLGDALSNVRKVPSSSTKRRALPTTVTLPLLVFVDMFAVSLVVPLLFQYYKQAGINSASQREWLSSLFSSSQIFGGILMGILTDANMLARQTLLYISFIGSAVSYALIVYGGLPALVFSRILVGLVKQTMTVTTTMLTHSTLPSQRAQAMGRLTAASTVAWIVGPTAGALVFKYVDPSAPALIACTLFILNLILAVILLPSPQLWRQIEKDISDIGGNDDGDDTGNKGKDGKVCAGQKQVSTWSSIGRNLQAAFSSRSLGAVVASRLIYTFVTRATSYTQLGSFYEDMYGLEPHHRGYISSYQSFLRFVVQAVLVGPIMKWSGGERQTAAILGVVLAGVIALESLRSLWLFLIILSPIIALCMSMINLSLQTLTTQVAPTHSIFSILTALDVLQSVVSVSVPFYRTLLFSFLTPDARDNHMEGDPDPVSWIVTSAIHWTVAAGAISLMLVSSTQWCNEAKTRKCKNT